MINTNIKDVTAFGCNALQQQLEVLFVPIITTSELIDVDRTYTKSI